MNDNRNYMSPGDKVIMTYNSPFVDSDALFVEYHDIIRCSRFSLIYILHNSEYLSEFFDISNISGLSLEELYEWYVNRKFINVFMNLSMNQEYANKNGITEENYEKWIYNFEKLCLKEFSDKIYNIYKIPNRLKFFDAVQSMANTDVVKRVFIYSDYKEDIIEEDIKKNFNERVQYVYGDMVDVIKENNISRNSSFVFSDITKINDLIEAEVLSYSSIMLPSYYGYNFIDDTTPIVDIEGLLNDTIFKFYHFDATEILPNEESFVDES